jgi:hypothetical protein
MSKMQDAPPLLAQIRPNRADPAEEATRLYSTAPRRGIVHAFPPVYCTQAKLSDEHALLECVKQACKECCTRCSQQRELCTYREVRPEVVSLAAPPERCWFVQLRVPGQERAEEPGEVEGIVALQRNDLHILLW